MSTKTESKKKTTTTKPRAEVGEPMPGRDILVRALEREGVEVIFAYPGGGMERV